MSRMGIFGIACVSALAACSQGNARDGAASGNTEIQPGVQTVSVIGQYLVYDGTQTQFLGDEPIDLTTPDGAATYGATTHEDGSFGILNVPFGWYVLTATGYAPSLVDWAQRTNDGNWLINVDTPYIMNYDDGTSVVQVGRVFF